MTLPDSALARASAPWYGWKSMDTARVAGPITLWRGVEVTP